MKDSSNDTTSTIDCCTSIHALRIMRCKQFNDLVDDIARMVSSHTKMLSPNGTVESLTDAAKTLYVLMARGFDMAEKCKYFEVKE